MYHLSVSPSPSVSVSVSVSYLMSLDYFPILVFVCDREAIKTLVSETEYQKADHFAIDHIILAKL